MNDYLQLAIAGVIVVAVFFTVWRHGRNNPESTGQLARRMRQIEETCAGIDPRIVTLEQSIERLTASTATSEDIAGLRQMIADDRAVNDRTWAAVSRIQDFFIERGIGARK